MRNLTEIYNEVIISYFETIFKIFCPGKLHDTEEITSSLVFFLRQFSFFLLLTSVSVEQIKISEANLQLKYGYSYYFLVS